MLARLARPPPVVAPLLLPHLLTRSISSSTRTLYSPPSNMSEPVPAHQLFATTNFSLSGASGLYDRARPSYPADAISSILSRLPAASSTGEGALIVELGAGTGLFTRGLLSALSVPGSPYHGRVRKVLAVEPSEGMRVGFEKGLEREGLRGADGKVAGVEVECVEGTFEKVPVGEGEADLVVIAQAFHWIGHDGSRAVDEIARVLKPGATWAKIWNLEDRNTPWVAQLRDTYEKFEKDTPQYRLGYWRSIWDLPSFPRLFTSPESHDIFTRSLPTTEDLVVDRIFSKSYITALSDEERKGVEEKAREIVRRGEGKEWIEAKEGVFAYPYATDLFMTTRK